MPLGELKSPINVLNIEFGWAWVFIKRICSKAKFDSFCIIGFACIEMDGIIGAERQYNH